MEAIRPSFRGVFHSSEDPEYWQEAMEEFPNRVPRFQNKEDTINFMKTYCQIGSNPDEPHLRQSITTMTTWSQIEQHLLPKIHEYNSKWKPVPLTKEMEITNRYMGGKGAWSRGAEQGALTDGSDGKREEAIKAFLKTTSWRRYQTPEGKIYYHDKVSKVTEWTMPRVLADFLSNYDSKREEEEESDKEGGNGDEVVKPDGVYEYITSRLNLPVHFRMNKHSSINTLRYLFFHMRCGIYVMIRNNSVAIFCPFVNKDYRNNWADVDPEGAGLKLESVDGKMGSYYAEKENHYRRENVLPDIAEWWANGNIICNEHEKDPGQEEGVLSKSGSRDSAETKSQYWGDQFLLQLKDMLAETCRCRRTPDCEFFINKRDYPQLKVHEGAPSLQEAGKGGADFAGAYDVMTMSEGKPKHSSTLRPNAPVEPYGFIFDRDDTIPEQDLPLSRHSYASYAPILSFYTSKRFADIPMPPSEDWESACGEIFPPSFRYTVESQGGPGVPADITVQNPRDLFTAANLQKFDTPWESKVNTAFFRGTATGGGTSVDTNQRLHAAQLCYDWEHAADVTKRGASNYVPVLDAKITGWNFRDKKIASKKMTFLRKDQFPFEGDKKKNFVEIYKQSSYKYLLYIEGHCAACRYGFMMQLGSVILKVESRCVADSMWYFPLLRPFYDHVPVKADLSDLQEKIEWCRENDEKCREIASNAKKIYKAYVSKDGVLDYMQCVMIETAKRWDRTLPFGEAPARSAVPVPSATVDEKNYFCCMPNCSQTCEHALCLACLRGQEDDRAKLEAAKQEQTDEKLTREQRKDMLRKRRHSKAAEEKAARRASHGSVHGGEPPAKKPKA